jgi:hypothetical protein
VINIISDQKQIKQYTKHPNCRDLHPKHPVVFWLLHHILNFIDLMLPFIKILSKFLILTL